MIANPARDNKDASAASRLRRWAGHDGNGWLACMGLLYALLYITLWPKSFTTVDEACYMGMAFALRHGTVYPDAAGIQVITTFPVGAHMVSKYPLGMPALLALASVFGWHAALATNLAVHLLTFWVVIKLLRRLRLPSLFALLFLLHPTAVLYSRTVMADPVSGLLLALALEQYLVRRPLACGALIGTAILCRTGNVVALAAFALAWAWERRAEGQANTPTSLLRRLPARELLWLGAGALPFLLATVYYARVIADGRMAQNTGMFALSYFPQMFPGYALWLLLLYPGMLLAPILYRGAGRTAILLSCYGFVLLYSFWYYRDQGGSAVETLVVGQRYFLAVLPLFVTAYSAVLWPVVQKWPAARQAALSAGAFAVLFVGACGISARHARYVGQMALVRDRLLPVVSPQDTLLCNTQVGKLFGPQWGARHVVVLSGSTAPTVSDDVAAQVPPGGRLLVALWARPGHTDEVADAQNIRRLLAPFRPRPLFVRPALPEGVTLTQVLATPSPKRK